MGKFKSMLGGAVVGAGGMYLGLQYHLLLAPEGFLLVPRAPQHTLREAYADVQQWDARSWAAHPRLSLAVAEHGRSDLIGDGVKSGLIDGLKSSLTPDRQQLGESTGAWEPAGPADVPAPIVDGKIAESQSAPRRGYLPLSELFGLKSGAEEPPSADGARGQSMTPVLPTGSTSPPEVELLPSPDDVDLGQPQPLPRKPNSQWRQSDADVPLPQRSASHQHEWEPLTILPQDSKTR
ncbi:MAG: hypothetical protein AB7U20_06750 [Planctomycetaceae bacterium]